MNGLNIYYEIHGTGEPLILLHGGAGATGMFDAIPPLIANTRRVIAVDLGRRLGRSGSVEGQARDSAGPASRHRRRWRGWASSSRTG